MFDVQSKVEKCRGQVRTSRHSSIVSAIKAGEMGGTQVRHLLFELELINGSKRGQFGRRAAV